MALKYLLALVIVMNASDCMAQLQKQSPKKGKPYNTQKADTTTGKKQYSLAAKGDTVPQRKGNVSKTGYDPISDVTFADYDELFSELDALLDSLYMPKNFAVLNVGVSKGFFDFYSADDSSVQTKTRAVYSPSFGYFHKSGFGISGGASLLNDIGGLRPFQFSLTGSFDFLKNRNFITGVAFSHFFTKDDLSFYTSPLQNEAYGYFTYRDLWLKPSVGISYSWGSRSEYESRQEQINLIKKEKERKNNNANNGNGNGNSGNGNSGSGDVNIPVQIIEQQISSVEHVADLNITASLRHDFYFLHLLSRRDYFRFTPQIALVSGTRQFGFNQTTNTFLANKRIGTSELFNTENNSFENRMNFKPISLTTFLKTEYVINKFFVQPQVAFDYYLPASENNLTATFFLNAGFVF